MKKTQGFRQTCDFGTLFHFITFAAHNNKIEHYNRLSTKNINIQKRETV